MKTTILTFAGSMLLSCITCFAQVPALQKGSLLVGGGADLSFSNYKVEGANYPTSKSSGTSFALSPQVGYFVSEGLIIGGLANLSMSTTKASEGDAKYTSSDISVGPFLRYYTKSKIFFHGEYTVGSAKDKSSGQYSNEYTSKLSGWKLGIGYAAFLNNHIALEPHVMYASNTTKGTGDYSTKFTAGQLTIGVTFTLFLFKD